MFALFILAADAPASAPATPAGGQPQGGMLDMLPLFAIIFFIFYFLVIRPQSKEKRKREALLKEDKIVTTAGIHGRIVSTDDLTVLVEVDDGVRLRFDRAAVWQVKAREGEATEAPAEPEAATKKS